LLFLHLRRGGAACALLHAGKLRQAVQSLPKCASATGPSKPAMRISARWEATGAPQRWHAATWSLSKIL
jgi:hypothetical protein